MQANPWSPAKSRTRYNPSHRGWNLMPTPMGILLALSLFAASRVQGMSQNDADALAASLLTQSGRHCTMIAVPHCGSGELAQSFWNQGGDARMIVDAFESDPALLESAQQKANALGLLGRNVYVRSGSLSTNAYSMPYADHYCDLICATGLADTNFNAISYAEIERVLCAGAQAWIGRAAVEGAGLSASTLTNWINAVGARALSSASVVSDATGIWAVITKVDRLPDTYEGVSKPAYSGSYFYNDKKATWPCLPQWFVKPYGNVGANGGGISDAALQGTCAGGGRVYGTYGGHLRAFRAYSGQTLWDRTGSGTLNPYSKGIVCGTQVLDGESGSLINTLSLPSGRRMVDNDILYVAGSGTLFAYDLVNQVTLYSKASFAGTTALAGGKIYVFSGSTVYCYNALAGTTAWGPVTAPASISYIRASASGVLLQSGSYSASARLYFLSAVDGSVLWGPVTFNAATRAVDIGQSDNFNSGREFVVAIGNGPALDLLTGATLNKQVPYGGHASCGNGSMTPAGTFPQANGMQYSFAMGSSVAQGNTFITPCGDGGGAFAASGMTIYENKGCRCYGVFMGEKAEAPMPSSTAFNPEQTAVEAQRLEKGPAYTNLAMRVLPDALDWPTHRANNSRSGATPARIATDNCVQLWKYTNPTPNVYFTNDYTGTYHDITPPVTAGGYTYLAGSDGIVKCFQNSTGSNIWSYATGGWIFATPTVANGCVYVGSGDGYAYCIEAHTGKLVWRFRAAPAERRWSYYGHMISAWPIMTGVLVHTNGLAYFVSGIRDEYGVQAFAVDARTGSLTNGWQNTLAGVYLDNRPGLARIGLLPGGYMTVAGSNLWVKGGSRPNWGGSAHNQRMGLFNLQTGALSANDTSIGRSDTVGNTGRQIGSMGNYVIGWGEDLHTEMQYRGAGGYLSFMQTDASGNVTKPFPFIPSAGLPNSDINCFVWDSANLFVDHKKYTLASMMQSLDATVSTNTGDALIVGLPTQVGGWTPGSVGGTNRATALTANVLVEVNSGGDMVVMDRALGTQLFHISSGGEPYLQSLAVDRSGKMIVANRNGDLVCYGTTNVVIVAQPTDVSGINQGQPAIFSVEAAGVAPSGSLSYQWYHNGQLIAGSTNATCTISSTTAADLGDYYVIVSNGSGFCVPSGTAALSFTVKASITSPSLASGTLFGEPGNILISANASSLHGAITGLEIWQGTNRLGATTSTNYSLVWTNATAGNYSLTARAYDNLGATGVSSAVNISVAKLAVHMPFDDGAGTVVTNTAGNVNGKMINNSIWEKQSLFNGGIHVTSPVYTVSGEVTLGPVTALTNSAFTVAFWVKSDFGAWPVNQSAFYLSDKIAGKDASLSSFNGSTAPYLTWYTTTGAKMTSGTHSPASNTWYHYAIVATPAEVDWYVNGALNSRVTPSSGTMLCSYTNFIIGNSSGGNYGFQGIIDEVQIFDNALSANAIMGLASNLPYRIPPTISITSPTNNTVITSTNAVTLTVNTTVSNFPLTVIYYQNGTLIGTNGLSPYSLTWNNVPRGSYTLTAVAVDGLNQTITSSPVQVQFTAVTPPTVSLMQGTYAAGQSVTVSCSDPNALIYYTTNGVDPTASNGILITSGSSITISGTMVLKLRTFEAGLFPSEVQSFVYRIGGALAAGGSHSTVLKPDGALWSWGNNLTGQLGDGTGGDYAGENTQRNTPVMVNGMTNVVAVADGWLHSLALKADGTVWVCGRDADGQLGNGKVIGGATGDEQHYTVWNKNPNPVGRLSHVISVAAGQYHSLALKSDGTVWAWGGGGSSYNFGQLGDGTTQERDTPVQVGASVGFGNAVAIACGFQHSLAVLSDGTVWACGYNNHGQLGNGTTTSTNLPVQVTGLTGVMAVAGGMGHSLALTSDGTVWAWGYNYYGQLGDGTTTQRLAPVQVSGLSGVLAIAVGQNHSLAVKNDGTVWAWGYNYYGQLGDGTTSQRLTPVQVGVPLGFGNVVSIASGTSHSLALKSDGSVWAWGYNSYGQLGNGTTSNTNLPTAIAPSSTIVSLTLAAQTIARNGGPVPVTARLWAPVNQDVLLSFTNLYVASGGATLGTDFTLSASPLTIPAGQISASIVVTPLDTGHYTGTRNILLGLVGAPVNAVMGGVTNCAIAVIDNEVPPVAQFTSDSQTVFESAGTATLTAQFSTSAGTWIPVSYLIVGGTAVNGTDYVCPSSGTIQFNAGMTSSSISVTISNRTAHQVDRTVVVSLTPASTYTLGATSTHTLTIIDREAYIATQPSDQTVNWGQPATFSVAATGPALIYQWFKNGGRINGATNASYTTPVNGVADDGTVFSVGVSNAFSTVTSSNALLTVLHIAPPTVSITSPLDGDTVTPPETMIIQAVAQSLGKNVKVEFFHNGTQKLGEATKDPFILTLQNVPSGAYHLTAVDTDNQGQMATSAVVNVTVTGAYYPALAITTASLPTGVVGITYNQGLAACGGTPGYSWSIISNGLPVGLGLVTGSGAITGTPAIAVTTSFTARVTDAAGSNACRVFSISAQSAYNYWCVQSLGTTNVAVGGPLETPAHDGIANLMKYALGLDPLTPGYQNHFSCGVTNQSGQSLFALTYTCPYPAPMGITYAFDAADDVRANTWTNTTITVHTNINGDGTATITVHDNAVGNLNRFMRLLVTGSP